MCIKDTSITRFLLILLSRRLEDGFQRITELICVLIRSRTSAQRDVDTVTTSQRPKTFDRQHTKTLFCTNTSKNQEQKQPDFCYR